MALVVVLYIIVIAAAPYKKHNDEDHDHDRDDGGSSHRHDYDGVRTGRPNLGRDGHGQRWQQDTDHHRGESDEKHSDRHNIVHGHNDGDRKFS